MEEIKLAVNPIEFRHFLLQLIVMDAMWTRQPDGVDPVAWAVVHRLIAKMKRGIPLEDLKALNETIKMIDSVMDNSRMELNLVAGAGESIANEIKNRTDKL